MTTTDAQTGDVDSPIAPTGRQSWRLTSLDALRGFDMFWIIGGEGLVAALAAHTGWQVFHTMEEQLQHPDWHGFRAYDLIFPLFMFIAGTAMPFSLGKRLERGDSKVELYLHVIKRGLLLVLLGMIYNGLLNLDFGNQRYPSVLGRIGLGYMFAGLIFLSTSARGQWVCIVGILLGYWAALMLIPVPEFGAGDLSPGHTLGDYIDRMLIPGKLYRGVRDPEGLFSTIPSIATVLLGAASGHWLRRPTPGGHQKALGLFIAGAVSLGIALVWDRWFPINKNLWTSSFVMYTAGWSLILLAAFYLVIDVWGFKRWSFFFVVIGMNAITIYLASEFVDFGGLAEIVFARGKGSVHPVIFAAGGLLLEWLLLWFMYRQRIFLRV